MPSSPFENMPLIRIEVERLKFGVMSVLGEYTAQLDQQMRAAVDAALEPERLQEALDSVVKREIDECIRKEVEKFFRYGTGSEVIKELVNTKLEKDCRERKEYEDLVRRRNQE